MGNKGSLGLSMKIFENRICFVCSHFAADTEKLEKRNSDYRSTKQRLRFIYNNLGDFHHIDTHDTVFWFGDLNYRLDKLSLQQTIEMIMKNQINDLIEYDQLTIEKNKKNIFEDFNEGKIRFRPTYKFVIGTDTYEKQDIALTPTNDIINESKNVKAKLPSWTDRIFWRSTDNRVTLIKYSCVNIITISDHKPVCGYFDVQIKKIDQEKYNKLYDEMLKLNDHVINKEMPRISISENEMKFGKTTFYDIKKLKFTVKNVGMSRTNINILFYSPLIKLDDDENHKTEENKFLSSHKPYQWVQINPQCKERIEPGASYNVELRTNFNCHILKRLNNELKIDDFLIVKCLGGNDLFVTITSEYEPTIIGFSLKSLSTLVPNSYSPNSNLMTTQDIPFIESDLKFLISRVEKEIEEFEKNIDVQWRNCFKQNSIKIAEGYAGKLEKDKGLIKTTPNHSKSHKFYDTSEPKQIVHYQENNFLNSRIENYRNCLKQMKNEIIEKDNYFYNDLSSELEFFLNHLIERCAQNMIKLDETSDEICERFSQFNLEDQKNLILICLSAKDFEKFEKVNFDVEVLVQVLSDLLYALPTSLIPSRYIDYCFFIDTNYNEALYLLDYIPVSHFKLFEYLVKFLQLHDRYIKTSVSTYDNLFANAIFQTNLSQQISSLRNSEDTTVINKECKAASKFLKIFIDNHQNFRYI